MRSNTESGHTLIEVMVALAVISLLASAMAPSIVRHVDGRRHANARAELAALERAVYGNGKNDEGYLGDTGRLPVGDLRAALITGAGQGRWSLGRGGVLVGWKGPYLESTDALTDPWGRLYRLDRGQIRSAGADGHLRTADDLVAPPVALPDPYAPITIEVKSKQKNGRFVTLQRSDAIVRVYSPRYGVSADGRNPADAASSSRMQSAGTAQYRSRDSSSEYNTRDRYYYVRGVEFSRGLHTVEVIGRGPYRGQRGTAVARVGWGPAFVSVEIR